MSTQAYLLDGKGKTLSLIDRKSMSELGFSEPGDLETWLASCKDQLFARKILWLARQDWPTDDQRSDIIGLSDNGDLVVAELKRGRASESAITQVLAYAAEYGPKTPEQLAQLYFEHSQKTGATALIEKAASLNEAQSRISSHVGENEVNQSQILLMVAEGFEDKALAICDYLIRTIGEATFSVELWQYGVFPLPSGEDAKRHMFLLEQMLPPPSIRAQIEAEREAAKGKKWARDPKRMEFMRELASHLSTKGIALHGSQGQPYSRVIELKGQEVIFQVPRWEPHPWMKLPDSLRLDADLAKHGLQESHDKDGFWRLEFSDVDAENLNFETKFGDRVISIIADLKPMATPPSSASTPSASEPVKV
jgi:hypothetical protein